MSDIKSTYSDYVRYVLQSSKMPVSRIMEKSPGGWDDDELELDRHKDYHGIFYSFNDGLEFYKEDRDYILDVYNDGDVNADLRLRRDVLKDIDGDVKWVTDYIAIADFNTMQVKDEILTISFNSNDLAEIIKTHESDEFEIERLDTIDDEEIPAFSTYNVSLDGRSIVQVSESKLRFPNKTYEKPYYYSPLTDIVSQGSSRHATVDIFDVHPIAPLDASNMFFVKSSDPNALDLELTVKYSLKFSVVSPIADGYMNIWIYHTRFNESNGIDEIVNYVTLYDKLLLAGVNYGETLTGTLKYTMQKDDGLSIVYRNSKKENVTLIEQKIVLNAVEFYNQSPSLKFGFVHDVASRLMQILTKRTDAFYSKFYGRKELGYKYDGEGALLGLMHGLWARNFTPGAEGYKSLTVSLKDLIDSLKVINNVGISVETVNYKERLRIEDLKYFYRNEVVVRLPYQIQKVTRKVDKNLFFSALEFGYENGGDYEDSMGLDEPNTRTNWITPIRKNKNKFSKLSKIRTDDYGLELARRKPQDLYPLDDTPYDEAVWFLDLKRTTGTTYAQKNADDRLNELPSGVFSPESFRSMYFTPLRLLFRHAWVFRAGLEYYLDKKIKFINSKSNSKLVTWFKGDTGPYSEDTDLLVGEISRSRFLPEIVEFEHPVDDELMNLILGRTEVEDENGEKEMVRNYYFKFEYMNENGDYERGYLMNLKPSKSGKFIMQKANEKLL